MHVFLGAHGALGWQRPRVQHTKHKQKCSVENSQQKNTSSGAVRECCGRTGDVQIFKTFNNGSLGSRIDEERSEMRYVV